MANTTTSTTEQTKNYPAFYWSLAVIAILAAVMWFTRPHVSTSAAQTNAAPTLTNTPEATKTRDMNSGAPVDNNGNNNSGTKPLEEKNN